MHAARPGRGPPGGVQGHPRGGRPVVPQAAALVEGRHHVGELPGVADPPMVGRVPDRGLDHPVLAVDPGQCAGVAVGLLRRSVAGFGLQAAAGAAGAAGDCGARSAGRAEAGRRLRRGSPSGSVSAHSSAAYERRRSCRLYRRGEYSVSGLVRVSSASGARAWRTRQARQAGRGGRRDVRAGLQRHSRNSRAAGAR